MSHFCKKLKSKSCLILIVIGLFFLSRVGQAESGLISAFPMDRYNQTISAWLNPEDADYDKPLLNADTQQKRFTIFLDHYIGDHSPWSEVYINKLLQQLPSENIKAIEQVVINLFNNKGKTAEKIGYGANYLPHTSEWIATIEDNINISQLDGLTYQEDNRGITTENLYARALPTNDPSFHDAKIAGEGYPFDYLQMSAFWVGTPVYILAESRDHAWMLVATSEVIAWVKSSGIARADKAFIATWTTAVKNKIAAITHTKTRLIDAKGNFLSNAYVGTVLPEVSNNTVLVPVLDSNHKAKVISVTLPADSVVTVPLLMTRHNMASIISSLIGRTYGWGNMYFYNDCSAEIKNLLTAFGIWLPRNTPQQPLAGNTVDLSNEPVENRLADLMKQGHPLLTLITIGGHVMLYVGNYTNPLQPNTLMPMTYQNAWGLEPNPPVRRAVIGKAVFFPLLSHYPEDTTLESQANKTYFRLTNLDEFPRVLESNTIDLKVLMVP
jgi:cell wall-associated NlpC family hydrolase